MKALSGGERGDVGGRDRGPLGAFAGPAEASPDFGWGDLYFEDANLRTALSWINGIREAEGPEPAAGDEFVGAVRKAAAPDGSPPPQSRP